MGLRCDQSDGNCRHYIPDYNVGFKVVTPMCGDHYDGNNFENHTLVFLIEGDIEFSYNDYLNRRFKQGDIFFIPQAAQMYGTALTDARMLVLSFNNKVESLCDRCRISEQIKCLPEIEYDFKPLEMTDLLFTFVQLMEGYLAKGARCTFLHELKQKELFILLGVEYDEKSFAELFYPVLGSNTDFKSRVLENYHYGLDVSNLADKMGMSYSPFLRQFKREFGETVKDWMLKQKAKHIKLRMSLPSTTISDVIREFNFTDLPHFVRFCRQQYGCTPKELLNSIKHNKTEV